MHDHDLDLIMALAEGTLDASDVPAAEASIAACDQCAGDLALQQQALSALSAAPRVGLTETESVRMHRSLRDELGLSAAADVVAVSTARRRRFGWTGALSAAAVLVIVILAAPTLNLLGGGDDADMSAEEVFAVGSPTTTVAESEASQRSAADDDGAADGGGAGLEEALESPTAAAETTTTIEASAEAGRLRSELTLEEIAAAYEPFSAPNTMALYASEGAPVETDEFDRCAAVGIDQLEAEGSEVADWSFTGLRTVAGSEQAVLAYQLTSGDVAVLAHDSESCEVIARS